MRKRREVLYVGERIQRQLAKRAVAYWVLCLTIVFASTVVSLQLSQPDAGVLVNGMRAGALVGPSLVVALCFLPWVVIDVLRTSNRFSGPLNRIRRSLHIIRAGNRLRPLRIRKNDLFHDLVADINSLAASLGRLDVPAPPKTGALEKSADDPTLAGGPAAGGPAAGRPAAGGPAKDRRKSDR